MNEQVNEMSRRLDFPRGRIDVVLDTDTYNEVDDQFALAYLLNSEDRLDVKGIFAAPFHNLRSRGPGDGMEKSYEEIHRLLELMGREDKKKLVYRGARQFLAEEAGKLNPDTGENNDAAARLIELSQSYTAEHPLYVVSIAAATNVASALIREPSLKERIVVVWLGGNALHWPHNREFNLEQDMAAARVVLGSGVPVVLLPCQGVVSELSLTKPELEYWLKGKNRLCDDLTEAVCTYMEERKCVPAWSKTIWDAAAVGWLIDERFTQSKLVKCPLPSKDGTWETGKAGHEIRYVYHVERDLLFYDMFCKLIQKYPPLTAPANKNCKADAYIPYCHSG